MDNNNGCSGCEFFTHNKRCCFEGDNLECLEVGQCSSYEPIKQKIMDIIKNKIDRATSEELQEALEFIEEQFKIKDVNCTTNEVKG